MTVSRLQEPLVLAEAGVSHRARIPRRLFAWTITGGLAILDHGLFSGCNFATNILLARWLAPEQYGAYAVAFAVYLLLLMLYQSVLLEPMAVFGSAVYRDCLRGYVKTLLRLHLALGLLIFLVLCGLAGLAVKLAPAGGLPGALFGLALAGPLVLLLGLARRVFYLELRPAPAAFGALLYCALTLGGLYLTYRYHFLSPFSALMLVGIGALAPTVLLFAHLKWRLPLGLRVPSLGEIWDRHWRYGRWALAGYAMMWIPVNIFYPLVGSFSGIAAAGALRALMNLASPFLQTYSALSALVLPYVARVLKENGYAMASSLRWRITLFSVSGAVVYWAVLLLLQAPMFHVLYNGKYMEVGYLLPVVALGSVCGSAFFGSGVVLRAMQSPASVFTAVCVSNCISLAIGVPITWALGLRGAVWSMTFSEALNFVIVAIVLSRMLRPTPKQPELVPESSA